MPFRIAFGDCSCSGPLRDEIDRLACQLIERRLAGWRADLPEGLPSIPLEAFAHERVEGHSLTLSDHRQVLDTGETLIVAQILVHTWRRPTYLSFGAVGRLYAEGLLVSADGGRVDSAPPEHMWGYR